MISSTIPQSQMNRLNQENLIHNSLKRQQRQVQDKMAIGYNETGFAFIKEDFFSLLETTSCHGIPNIVRGKHLPQKIVWVLIFLAFLAYSIYSVISLVLNYLEFNVLVQYQITQNFENLVFPAITICNIVPFDFSNKTNLNLLYTNLAKTSPADTYFYTSDNLTLCSTVNSIEIISKYPEYKNIYAYSMSTEKMIISCYYHGEKCLSEDWTEYHSTNFGRCAVFNKIGSRKVRRAGCNDGLQIEFFLGESQYKPCWSYNIGAAIAIHNQSIQAVMSEECNSFLFFYIHSHNCTKSV